METKAPRNKRTMTCIVGLVHDGSIYMGGDSCGVSGYDLKVRLDPKVFVLDKRFVIGFADSFRMGQLLRFSLKLPAQTKHQDDYEFMCTSFVDAVRKCFGDGGFLGKNNDDSEREEGGSFLVGYRGVLYEVDVDFQVGINQEPYCALGCGASYAHGSLFATATLGWDPEKRIVNALEAAVNFSTSVRGPFVILKLPSEEKP